MMLCGLAWPGRSGCQTVILRGGESQQEQALGGGVTLTSLPYSLDVFSGVFDGRIEIGANIKAEFKGYKLVAGDQMLEIRSSIYGDQARGFYARGGAVTIPLGKRVRATVFGGLNGLTEGSSMFEVVRPNQPIGSLQLERTYGESFTVFLHSLFSSRQTVIGGFGYRHGAGFSIGAQAGVGSNTPYAAVTVDYSNKDRTTILDGSYSATSRQFQMVDLSSLNYQDPLGANAQFLHHFGRRIQLGYHLSNYQSIGTNGALSEFSGNNLSFAGKIGRTGWNAGYNQSSGQQVVKETVTKRAGQQINFGFNQSFGRYHFNVAQYQPISATGQASVPGFTTITVQEPLGRWISLRQMVNHSSTWGIAYGGEIHNNRLNFSLDYQTTYSLFSAGQSRFQKGMVAEGEVNLPGGAKLYIGTDVTPDGRFYYKWGTRVSFKGPYQGGHPGLEPDDNTPSIPRFMVSGKVLEAASGKPVADFPVNMGQDTVFTNEDGEFTIRLYSGRVITAAPDTMSPHAGFQFRLVNGPAKVQPVKNGPGTQYIWKVERGIAVPATGQRGLIVVKGS